MQERCVLQTADESPEAILVQACRQLSSLFPAKVLPEDGPPVSIEPPPGPGRRSHPRQPAVRVLPQDLLRPKRELLAVLLHGMVHYVNGLRGVKDCSRGHYHNLCFRHLAERVGLRVVAGNTRFGWAATVPEEPLAARFDVLDVPPIMPPPPPPSAPPPPFPPKMPPVRPPRSVPTDQDPEIPDPLVNRAWRCGLNLSGQPRPIPWRGPASPPEMPRFRLSLVRETGVSASHYPWLPTDRDAAALCWKLLEDFDREAVVVLYLDSQRRLIGYSIPYIGTLDHAYVEPRGVLVPALMMNAAGVIVGHNHPSGDPSPSHQDHALSVQLVEAGRVVGVPLVASLVVGGPGCWRRILAG